MSRLRTILTVALPSMLAGGLVFGNAFSFAATGDQDAFWPPPVVIAQADPQPPKRPVPPAPPAPPAPRPPRVPPAPPTPPAPPKGVNVQFGADGIQITGVREMVAQQLANARASIANDKNIPADVRSKILARLDKVNAAVDKRMANLKIADLEKFEEEMERMGEEIEEAMEGFDKELEKLGPSITKNLTVHLGQLHDLDDIDIPSPPDIGDTDDDDMREAISDLKDMALKPAQRDKILKLRADSDRRVADAKKQIHDLSAKLRTALDNSSVSDAEISKLVDQISSHEAAMRKARITAWAQARRELDTAQRKKVEDAAKKTK